MTRPFAKDPAPFLRHGNNLESRLERQHGYLTPAAEFFVRNSGRTPRIAATGFRLRIEGDAVARPCELGYDELCALPGRSVIAYLDCAGNWRSYFATLFGRKAPGAQWGLGAVGCAEWTGVPLARVLERAGITADAQEVNLIGLDDTGFSRPLPVAKALDEDTLLAVRMNGEPLGPDHGFPLRAIVPGWVGSSSIKWLGRIVVSSRKVWVENNTTAYVMLGRAWPRAQYAPARGGPITLHNIKSSLALPWPAHLAAGRQRLRGVAYSPHAPIRQIEWRLEGDSEWRPALLTSPVRRYAWVWFECAWTATPGRHVVRVRATDCAGNRQPEEPVHNTKGYLFNAVLPHPVQVA